MAGRERHEHRVLEQVNATDPRGPVATRHERVVVAECEVDVGLEKQPFGRVDLDLNRFDPQAGMAVAEFMIAVGRLRPVSGPNPTHCPPAGEAREPKRPLRDRPYYGRASRRRSMMLSSQSWVRSSM